MISTDQIEAPGKIIEVLAHGGYRAELANGHVCVARSLAKSTEAYPIGEAVRLSFHPADLSRARILNRIIA